jgi:argininosuccinate lyase
MDSEHVPVRLWGGRFKHEPAPELTLLSNSGGSDWRLAVYDLAGSRAHARELQRAGVLNDEELQTTLAGIDALERDVRSGAFSPSEEDEDVYTALERGLLGKLGALGGKLRAGRSRNDQTANDSRQYLRWAARQITPAVVDLAKALVVHAYENVDSVAPGFTHLQPAQPVSFGHQLAAHAQALARDLDRLREWDSRTAYSPLGAAALAGSTIAVHPDISAQELGYVGPVPNSMDAVSDRDFMAEFLFVTALIGVHLSRLGEEICLWTSRQFQWVELDDSYATGSSIMPQKKNPDIAEMARGATGPFIGNLTAMLVMVKGLPLTYNRDLTYDTAVIFDTVDKLLALVPAMTGMVRTMRVNREALAQAASGGFTLATDVADWLARSGVPFRDAHEIVGRLVQRCEDGGCELDSLSGEDLAEVDVHLGPEVRSVLNVRQALLARCGVGGTAPQRVIEQLAALDATFESISTWASQ